MSPGLPHLLAALQVSLASVITLSRAVEEGHLVSQLKVKKTGGRIFVGPC